jgi:hypothetical protein
MVSEGVSVWIANDIDGTWQFTDKPTKSDGYWLGAGVSGVCCVDYYSHLIPLGECREFRVVPVDSEQPAATCDDCGGDAETIAALRAELEIARGRIAELEAKTLPVEVTPLALETARLAATFNSDNRYSVTDACDLAVAHLCGAMRAANRIEGGTDDE